MPEGESPVLCHRTRDSCRLAFAILPTAASEVPAAELAKPGSPAADGAAAAAPSSPARQQAPPAPALMIVSLDVADAAGAGPGAIVFVHRDLAELVALAQRLEGDETAALHGAPDSIRVGV